MADLDDIRRDVKAAAVRELREDVTKTVLFWGVALTLFYFATKDNHFVGPTSNLPMYLLLNLILLLIPVLYFKLWQYGSLMKRFDGKVVALKVGGERVPRTDRNIGYANHMADLAVVNVLYVTAANENNQTLRLKLVGNHLFAAGQGYYSEGDAVEKFAGARYFYNPNRKISRPLCLHCGYLGGQNEQRCSRCRCTLLKDEPCE